MRSQTFSTGFVSRFVRVAGILFASLVVLSSQERFRIADPQSLSASGSGWSVDPRTGALGMVMPVGQAGGEIPIPISLRIGGQFKVQAAKQYYLDYDTYNKPRWTYIDTSDVVRPMVGVVHLGYIAPYTRFDGPTNSETYVLEDGTQFRTADFRAFTSWASTFTLPEEFGFQSKAPSAVSISNLGSHATYSASSAEFGPSWQARLQAIVPTGFGTIQDSYRVLMDKDLARVMVKLPTSNVWVPVLWVDRFGHSVEFKWQRNAAGMPSGVNATYSVEARNQRSQGVLLQWADFNTPSTVQDLLKASFIGVDAPTMLVRGYPGTTSARPAGAPVGNAYAEIVSGKVAGPAGRPTQVVIGQSNDVPSCSWSQSAPPVSGGAGAPPSGTSFGLRIWSFEYDSTLAAIKSMTDAMGVKTTYTYEALTIPSTQVSTYSDIVDGEHQKYVLGDLLVWGVTQTSSYDSISGRTLSRSWSRGSSSSGDPNAILKETFGNLGSCARWTELVYVKSTDAGGRDYGNGALKESMLWESGKGTPIASVVYTLQGAGLDASYSYASGMVIQRSGEATKTVAMPLGSNGLVSENETIFSGSPAVKVQETITTFESRSDKLDFRRPTQAIVTRFAPDGSALSPVMTTKMEYDSKRLPARNYRQGASGQLGATYSFDSEGRLFTQRGWFGDGIQAPNYQANFYDGATGQLSQQTTYYLPEGGGTHLAITQSWSDFDTAGRAKAFTDSRGLVTNRTYDTLGRIIRIVPPAGRAVDINYPDAWTRTETRRGAVSAENVVITEKMDGFGRVTKRTLGDGSWDEFGYDDFGRLEIRRHYSNLGSPQAPATTGFDALDRPVNISTPGGAYQTFTYGVAGPNSSWNLVTRTLNTPGTTATAKEYRDGLGQVVQQDSPAGDTTTTSYDGQGNLLRVVLTPSGGGTQQIREFQYDEWGRMTLRNEPETGITRFPAFSLLGKPTRIEEPESRTRILGYDGLGRVVRMEGGKDRISYTYSGVDLVSMSSFTDGIEVRQEFEFNGLAKQLSLERTIQPGYTSQIGYGYDAATGLLSTITYPSGRSVGYSRDNLGRITGITNNGAALVSNVSFDEWGYRSRLLFASGAYSDWTTKDAGTHLNQWNIGYNNALLEGTRFYQNDSAERLTMAGEWDYLAHDTQNRLTSANSSSLGINTSHTHDAYGNNTGHLATGNVPSGKMNNFTFNPLPSNKLPEIAANGALTGWQINGRGEATQIGTGSSTGQYLNLGWDAFGRLKAVSYGAGFQSYLYAPSGMRVSLVDTANGANNRKFAYTSSGLLLGEYVEGSGAYGLRAASISPASAPPKPKLKANQKVAYVLPQYIGGGDPAGAWIDQPAGPTTVAVGQAVQFSGFSEYGESIRWTFGDGGSANGDTATHAYAAAGIYTATFRASAAGYLTSSATVRITVVASSLPTINTFSTSASTIPAGSFADLSWQVSNASSVSISGIGGVGASGSTRVWPGATTTYTLTATSSAGSVSSSVVVNVVQAPVFRSVNASPASMQPGQAARLSWQVDNANSYQLDQGIGAVPGTWAWVWPGSSTTFTLTATNTVNGVSVSRSTTVTVTVGAASGVAWKRDVIYLGSEAVAEIDGSGVHELHSDHLGSPRVITNGTNGQIEGRQLFGAFGEWIKSEGYIPATGYTGHLQQDATGLIYMRGRYYSPAWHRFLNSDQGVDPNSWNQNAYVVGSPFHGVDPSGMKWIIQPRWIYDTSWTRTTWTDGNGSYDSGWISYTTVSLGYTLVWQNDAVGMSGGSGMNSPVPQAPQKPDPCNDTILGSQKGYDDLKNLFRQAGAGFAQTERSAWVGSDSQGNYSGMTVWPWSAARRRESWSGPIPPGTFANVHTHPIGTAPWPSETGGSSGRGDLPLNDMGYSIYILSRQGIYMRAPGDTKPTQLAGSNWMEKPPCSTMKK